MRKTVDYICNLPNTAVITEKELNDPDWKLPFDNGIIILNNVTNEDENSPHIHLSIITVASSNRGN